MMPSSSITHLRPGGRIWALGALMGDDAALAVLGRALFRGWQGGDKLVVLGNAIGPRGNPVQTIDWLLALRRRLLAAREARACDVVFLRGAQEEMWHKALRLQFALTPLKVFDWMLERGLASTVEAYGAAIAEGRGACRNGPSAIARWTAGLRSQQALRPGHADLLNALARAARSAEGGLFLSAAGIDPARSMEDQADAFWWNATSDRALAASLAGNAASAWRGVTCVVRGAGPEGDETSGDSRVLTVSRATPALVMLDRDGTVLERIEP
jgi:serine/threonine protein phosphatase 1